MAKLAHAFKKGNGGRPKGSLNKATSFRKALTAVVNLTREKAMWASMLQKAVQGDVSAARLIAEYMHGKPHQMIAIEGKVEHEHYAIPDDELREIAVRNAERIMERNRSVIDAPVNGN